MAAMSFDSNWDSLQQPPPGEELFNFHNNFIVDPFLQPDELICYNNLFSYSPAIYPSQEFNHPKRQKCWNAATPPPDFLPELPPPVSVSISNNENKVDGMSLSAQSIAARERRRKITEKTQELGKLVPGGNKMNTAEMFQACYNYVKFLQAQVSILQFMEETQPINKNKDVQVLLTSPLIQYKLYSEEKCLVPVELVHEQQMVMVNHDDDQSNDLVDELLNLH